MQECSHAPLRPAPSSMLCTLAADAGMRCSQGNCEPPMERSQPPPLCGPGLEAAWWGDVMPCMQTKPGAQMALGNSSLTSKGGLPDPHQGRLAQACTFTAEFHLLSHPAITAPMALLLQQKPGYQYGSLARSPTHPHLHLWDTVRRLFFSEYFSFLMLEYGTEESAAH